MTTEPLSLTPGNDDPADLSTESVIAELSRSTLGSEAVILEAPFSYVGSTKRTLRWFKHHHAKATWLLILEYIGLVLWLTLAWTFITGWYALFGLLLVPYRLIRRSARKNEKQSRQHAELLAQLGKRQR
jgi:hypothetical protein